MRFLIDAQLPPLLARYFADQGHHCEHIAAAGLAAASDRMIWDYAFANDAVLITKDEDSSRCEHLNETVRRLCGFALGTRPERRSWLSLTQFCRRFSLRWSEVKPSWKSPGATGD